MILCILNAQRTSLANSSPGRSFLLEPLRWGARILIFLSYGILSKYGTQRQEHLYTGLCHDQNGNKKVESYSRFISTSRIWVSRGSLTDRIPLRRLIIPVFRELVITLVFAVLYRRPLPEHGYLNEFRLLWKSSQLVAQWIVWNTFTSLAQKVRYQ